MVLVVLAVETIVSIKTEATRIKVALEVVMITTKVLAVIAGASVVSAAAVAAGLTILASTTT